MASRLNWPPQRVRALRNALGLTQPAFAAAYNVHPITIAKWESEARVTDVDPHYAMLLEETERQRAKLRSGPLKDLIDAGAAVFLGFMLGAVAAEFLNGVNKKKKKSKG